MTMKTRKHLSVAAVMASFICAVFLVASAFAAANAGNSPDSVHNWQGAEFHAPTDSTK